MSEQVRDGVTDSVLRVLREVIGNDDISPADDFYLVGGHSLLIMTVIERLHSQCDLDLDRGQFAANPRVAAIIEACRPVSP